MLMLGKLKIKQFTRLDNINDCLCVRREVEKAELDSMTSA